MTRRMILPLLFGLVGAAVLIGLGTWQVQRLQWKQGVLAEIEARIHAEPVSLPDTPDPELDRYLPVEITGEITGEELAVLVSVKQRGAKYRVISPMVTTNGRRILVDRGVRDIVSADTRPPGHVRLTGNLHWPRETDGFTPEPDREAGLWFARDVAGMADALGTEPVFVVARRMTPPDPSVTPLPIDTASIPNDHLGYAITWFSLALVWLGMTAAIVWRIRRQAD